MLITLILVPVLSCTKEPEPRRSVMDFLASLRADTTSFDYLTQLLDMDELIFENSIYTYDSTVSIEANKREFVALLQKGGRVRENWIRNQIIVGNVDFAGDTAMVEVSFIDKSTEPVKQYYNKMGVHLVDGSWKIFAFRLFSRE